MRAEPTRSVDAAAHSRMPRSTPLKATVKYNPQFWCDDDLRAIFVVHTQELATIVDALHATAPDSVPQHILITGQPGTGKSTLLRRIALAVRDTPELARDWLVLEFPEEQYSVSNLTEFWQQALDVLADTIEQQAGPGPELARLDAAIGGIADLPADAREAAALRLLTDWIAQHGQRAVFLIDNADLLLAGLAGGGRPRSNRQGVGIHDAGATPLWRLRKTLSHHKGIFWLGASCQALEAQSHYHDAFHDFFRLVELRPLAVDQMRAAMLALARTFGMAGLQGEAAAAAMACALDARPERLKAVRAMTGGTPRTTVTLYELFAAGAEGSVHSDLNGVLDMLTPLYKARIENLADQPRKLLAHLLELWVPQSARQLADASGIAVTTVSGQLSRLEADGLVEKVRLPGAKHRGYQVVDRLLNLWYLMRCASRRQRQRLFWLIEFMGLWFSADEGGDPVRTAGDDTDSGAAARSEATLAQDGPQDESLPVPIESQVRRDDKDVSRLALEALAGQAVDGDKCAFSRLCAQVMRSHQVGVGQALAGSMAESSHADFLRPFVLALRMGNGEDAAAGVPPELSGLAGEVCAWMRRGTPTAA